MSSVTEPAEPGELRTRPEGLRTEYAVDPIGLDERVPRFSWRLPGGAPAQTAYRVLVASSAAELTADRGDLWDSGRVDGRSGVSIPYAGTALRGLAAYCWKVQVWDGERALGWSEVGRFETGPLGPEDWAGAVWIGAAGEAAAGGAAAGGAAAGEGAAGEARDGEPRTDGSGKLVEARPIPPSPLLRRDFELSGDRAPVVWARLYVSGLGLSEAYLDGRRIGDRVLDPAPTDYDERVLFSAYDLTDDLQSPPTTHALGVMLGRGRFGEAVTNTWLWERASWWSDPKLLALLVIRYADGTEQRIGSDVEWRAVDGPVRWDSLYAGEIYDARRERPGWTRAGFDDHDWASAVEVEAPRGSVRAQGVEPMRVEAEFPAIGLTRPVPGVAVYDLRCQIAGWARLRLDVPTGTTLQIRYGERLLGDGRVDIAQPHIHADNQTDRYVARGGGPEAYEPRFSYKGFQYVEVAGEESIVDALELEALQGLAIHTDVRSTSEFETSSEAVNRLHAGARRALLNNLHGVPTDTPVFEKNGWTGDAQLTCEMAAYNLDLARFWTKWLRDWADAQRPSGELPPIVPSPDWGYRGTKAAIIAPIPAWDVAYFEIPWTMYRYYGDTRVLAEHYDRQRRYLDYLTGFVDRVNDVVLVGLGDYLPPGKRGIPPEGPGIYETAYTVRILQLATAIARVLGREGDIPAYDELAARVRRGFENTFYDRDSGTYHGENPTGYRQSANVIALTMGLVPAERERAVFDRLVADIHERDDHLDTGVIGTKFLFPLLTRYDEVDLAFRVAMRDSYPGYGYWLGLGATALYEMWDAESRSRDHHFFGHVDRWFVEELAGVSPGAPGYATVRIAPRPPRALDSARVALDTVRGRVEVAWRRDPADAERIDLDYAVPPGVRAELALPDRPATWSVRRRASDDAERMPSG